MSEAYIRSANQFAAIFREMEGEFKALVAQITDPLKTLPDPKESDLNQSSPRERRALVRGFFGFVACMLSCLKQKAINWPGTQRLSHGDRVLSTGEIYDLDDEGRTVPRPARTRFLSEVRFAFGVLSRAGELGFSLDVKGEGWREFRTAVEIRDRLMHPKSIEDLEVTGDELLCVMEAYFWFDSQLVLLMNAEFAALQVEVAQRLTKP